MKELNPIAKKWVEALRSKKYKQGQGELRPPADRFCCLGVLCELAIEFGVIKTYRHTQAYLPLKVQRWARLRDRDGSYKLTSLAMLNDKGESFATIAAIIERRPEGLFRD